MIRTAILALAAFVVASPAVAEEAGPDPAPIEVMVLGSYHFTNPGRDVVNLDVDDVLSDRRQREIAVLADALAGWKPTRVLVEASASGPDFELANYAEVDELLTTRRNESIQIGYRIANMLGHETVYGFDEQPSGDEPDYFPMGPVQEFAEASGQAAMIAQLFGEVQERVAKEQAALATQSIAESLLWHNDATAVDAGHDRIYYSLLKIGDGDAQPGAELNAYWYMRNAKMFAKLDLIAEPGDRVLAIVGSGHATWLRHFVERMPGYGLVDATPFLQEAAAASASTD
ncbi:MAG: hypothetical protein CL808_01240 [Citromicrobium sp.]|nr:hypothetical protein [Citromicrobium sp.]